MAPKKLAPLQWSTIQVKPSELNFYSLNPRKLDERGRLKLSESLDEFNLADIPVLNHDLTILSGNQRIKILIEKGKGDETIDARYPNRQLTELEAKKYAITANSHQGSWDLDRLSEDFSELNLKDFDISGIKLPSDQQGEGGNDTGSGADFDEGDQEYAIMIKCEDQEQQIQLLSRLKDEGLECQAIVV